MNELKEGSKAPDVFMHVKSQLSGLGAGMDKLGAICTDGAPVLTGRLNGVVALFEREAGRSIQFIHCVCHRMALVARAIVEKHMPKILFNLMVDMYTYFRRSQPHITDFGGGRAQHRLDSPQKNPHGAVVVVEGMRNGNSEAPRGVQGVFQEEGGRATGDQEREKNIRRPEVPCRRGLLVFPEGYPVYFGLIQRPLPVEEGEAAPAPQEGQECTGDAKWLRLNQQRSTGEGDCSRGRTTTGSRRPGSSCC